MDLGGIIGGIADAAGQAFGGGGGLDLGKIAGDAMGALGGGGGGGGDPLGGLLSEGVKLLTGGGGDGGGDPLGGLLKAFTGGGDAKSGVAGIADGLDLKGIAKTLNPNLPDDQAAGIDNVNGGIQSALSGNFTQLLTPGDASKAGTAPGKSNSALARANADKAISQIDWSKDTVGLWVPGTGSHNVDPKFAEANGENASTVAVDYQADLNMPDGVATGMETTQIILDEAAKRGKKVNLGGHSQGAWVAGEVAANPEFRDKINKAVLYGHPTQANAQFDGNRDGKVREINNPDDPYAQPTIDLGKIATFLLGERFDPNIRAQHAYDFASEAAWLRA